MLAFDHVVIAVADLDAAANRMYGNHGLGSVPGGRHPGHGTGNRIVPLGPDYLELMAVLDPEEAAESPMGRWVTRSIAEGDRIGALCLRTDDIEATASRLGLEPTPMSRHTPDGRLLSWRLAGVDRALAEGLPFFIQWDTDEHPGRVPVDHRAEVTGIHWIEYGGAKPGFDDWVGGHHLDLRMVPGPTGPRRVGIGTKRGEIVIG
jgi:hypothetical protein